MEFRDLKHQYAVLKPQMDAAVQRVMTECNFISGAQVKDLEAKLAAYVGTKHCITCANGTDALTLTLMAYQIGPGDAVFLPDFTFFATAETPAAQGATPIFVDVDPVTFNLCPKSLRKAIEQVKQEGVLRPRAILPVDLFGLPADYPSITGIAQEYGLIVIEDGAQGFGGRIGTQTACSFGSIATTSFFPAKPLGCYGDGGAIFTDDDQVAALIRSYAVHGKGTDKYDNVRLGLNSRLDTLQAAILSVKLDAFTESELDAVNTAAGWYTQRLMGQVKTPVVPEGYFSSWAQYTIQLDSSAQRDALQTALQAQGIPTMIYYLKGMHQQTAFSGVKNYVPLPVSEALCDTVLSLPMHPYLTEEQVDFVCAAVLQALADL